VKLILKCQVVKMDSPRQLRTRGASVADKHIDRSVADGMGVSAYTRIGGSADDI